jgi:quinoprotein dehydrogenase-associated probable ABC transporter substrate-binding protein
MIRFAARGALAIALAAAGSATPAADALKVCADPANLPLSNEQGEGYENKIAAALARDLGRTLQYTFFPQRMGFVRNTLRAKDEATQTYKCDLIMGVPARYELTATTQPYMHSVYALIVGPKAELQTLRRAEELLSLNDTQRASLRIGVFTRSPGNDWLLKNALIERAVVYSHQSGDAEESPGLTIERDLKAGKIDVGILWGPMAAMLALRHDKEHWRAVPFTPDPTIKFDYEIAMGLRQGEAAWKKTLDEWIAAHGPEIAAILAPYQIPLVDATGQVHR